MAWEAVDINLEPALACAYLLGKLSGAGKERV